LWHCNFCTIAVSLTVHPPFPIPVHFPVTPCRGGDNIIVLWMSSSTRPDPVKESWLVGALRNMLTSVLTHHISIQGFTLIMWVSSEAAWEEKQDLEPSLTTLQNCIGVEMVLSSLEGPGKCVQVCGGWFGLL
jgi:hypothetical protein